MNKYVMVLSGHNEESPGATATIEGKLITEYSLTVKMVSEIFKREKFKNVTTVYMQRNDYSSLVTEVNRWNPDLLISCHFNSINNNSTQGTEVLYAATSKASKEHAERMQKILVKHIPGIKSRGTKPTKPEDRGGSILNKTKGRAILLEPFFLSNIKTLKELDERVEQSINAVMEFLKTL